MAVRGLVAGPSLARPRSGSGRLRFHPMPCDPRPAWRCRMGPHVGLADHDQPTPTKVLHESSRTRATRLLFEGRTLILMEPLGPDAERRESHERRILDRLRGLEGIAQLVEVPGDPGSLVLADAGSLELATLAKPLDLDQLMSLAVALARAVAG